MSGATIPRSRSRVIGFAHRGAPLTRNGANTLDAFERALALGATGLESDVALSADGVPVLAHQALSFRRISRVPRKELPHHIPSLEDLYLRCGPDTTLSLDMGVPGAAGEVVRIAERCGAEPSLWLTYWRLGTLEEWRRRWPHLHLVYAAAPFGRERSKAVVERLAGIGVDVLNVHHRFCSAQLADLVHQRGLRLFVWGVRREASLARVLQHEIDGVYCDDVEALARALARREE